MSFEIGYVHIAIAEVTEGPSSTFLSRPTDLRRMRRSGPSRGRLQGARSQFHGRAYWQSSAAAAQALCACKQDRQNILSDREVWFENPLGLNLVRLAVVPRLRPGARSRVNLLKDSR